MGKAWIYLCVATVALIFGVPRASAAEFAPPAMPFVVSLAQDSAGKIWVGTEDQGVFRYDPVAKNAAAWTNFTTKDGLGDDNAYAICPDKLGRVWVGHLNHGVSVYNGERWKNYDVIDGPIGERVFSIAADPMSGDIWDRHQRRPDPLQASITTSGATSRAMMACRPIKFSRWPSTPAATSMPARNATAWPSAGLRSLALWPRAGAGRK